MERGVSEIACCRRGDANLLKHDHGLFASLQLRTTHPKPGTYMDSLSVSVERIRIVRFSIRTLLAVTALSAVGVWWFWPLPSPFTPLLKIDAHIAASDRIDSDFGIMDYGKPIPVSTSIKMVGAVTFSPSFPPAQKHIRLLSRFPNLHSVYFPCEVNSNDMRLLRNCKSLEFVSFENSTATDDVIEHIASLPSVIMVHTENSRITESGIQRLRSSTPPKAVNQAFPH